METNAAKWEEIWPLIRSGRDLENFNLRANPPAEIWMTERVAESLLDRGLMPLASVRNSDAVQLINPDD